jgi:hypothetical protein
VFEDPADEEEEENLIGLLDDDEGGDGPVGGIGIEMVDREGGQEGGRDVDVDGSVSVRRDVVVAAGGGAPGWGGSRL